VLSNQGDIYCSSTIQQSGIEVLVLTHIASASLTLQVYYYSAYNIHTFTLEEHIHTFTRQEHNSLPTPSPSRTFALVVIFLLQYRYCTAAQWTRARRMVLIE
jgi:hypothetical protein